MKKIILISVIAIIAISLNSCKKEPWEKFEENPLEKLEGKWEREDYPLTLDFKVSKDSIFVTETQNIKNESWGEHKYKIDSIKKRIVFLSSGKDHRRFWIVKDTLYEKSVPRSLEYIRYKEEDE